MESFGLLQTPQLLERAASHAPNPFQSRCSAIQLWLNQRCLFRRHSTVRSLKVQVTHPPTKQCMKRKHCSCTNTSQVSPASQIIWAAILRHKGRPENIEAKLQDHQQWTTRRRWDRINSRPHSFATSTIAGATAVLSSPDAVASISTDSCSAFVSINWFYHHMHTDLNTHQGQLHFGASIAAD